jgi:hypothetical protein
LVRNSPPARQRGGLARERTLTSFIWSLGDRSRALEAAATELDEPEVPLAPFAELRVGERVDEQLEEFLGTAVTDGALCIAVTSAEYEQPQVALLGDSASLACPGAGLGDPGLVPGSSAYDHDSRSIGSAGRPV